MEGNTVIRQFGRMGARSRAAEHHDPSGLRADVRRAGGVEFFDLRVGGESELRVVDVRPELRHLLLLGIDNDRRKNKFLCGHEERDWFVPGVPNDRGVGSCSIGNRRFGRSTGRCSASTRTCMYGDGFATPITRQSASMVGTAC